MQTYKPFISEYVTFETKTLLILQRKAIKPPYSFIFVKFLSHRKKQLIVVVVQVTDPEILAIGTCKVTSPSDCDYEEVCGKEKKSKSPLFIQKVLNTILHPVNKFYNQQAQGKCHRLTFFFTLRDVITFKEDHFTHFIESPMQIKSCILAALWLESPLIF